MKKNHVLKESHNQDKVLPMEHLKAEFLFCDCFNYVVENKPDELKWVYSCSKEKFKDLTSKTFLSEYTWVVYAAGFDVRKIEIIFPKLRIDAAEISICQDNCDCCAHSRKHPAARFDVHKFDKWPCEP